MKLFTDPVRQETNLALPLDLDGARWEGFFRTLLVALSLFIFGLLLLATFAPVREVAATEGKVVPHGLNVPVQHFEGGIVDKVFVEEGDFVSKGQVLAELRPETGSGDVPQVRVRLGNMEIRRARLEASLASREPNFDSYRDAYPIEVSNQEALYQADMTAFAQQSAALSARLQQRETAINAGKAEIQSLKEQHEIEKQKLEMTERLLKQGFATRTALLQNKTLVENTKVRLVQARGQLQSNVAGVEEIKSEIANAEAQKRREWSGELVSLVAEMGELRERLDLGEDRIARLKVRASSSGRIQSLAFRDPGAVIKSGDVVAEIVPSFRKLEAEVKIMPKDIGHIRIGDNAEVTLSTYDAELFGKIEGELISLSPNTFETERGDLYFKGIVALDRTNLEHKGRSYPITPGMVVSANILTGSKTVLQYLLKPVYRSFDKAFSER